MENENVMLGLRGVACMLVEGFDGWDLVLGRRLRCGELGWPWFRFLGCGVCVMLVLLFFDASMGCIHMVNM